MRIGVLLLLKSNNDDRSPISHQGNVVLRTTCVRLWLLDTLLLLLKIKYKAKIQNICYCTNLVSILRRNKNQMQYVVARV